MERIDVRRLGPEATEFSWEVTAGALGLETEPAFRHPIKVEIRIRRIADRVIVSGTVGCRVRLECRRCLEEIEDEIKADVAVEYVEGPGSHRKEDVVRDEGADVGTYTPPFVDLRDDLRQVLLMAVTSYPLCGLDCRGLCPSCGTNLNTGSCSCGKGGVETRPVDGASDGRG